MENRGDWLVLSWAGDGHIAIEVYSQPAPAKRALPLPGERLYAAIYQRTHPQDLDWRLRISGQLDPWGAWEWSAASIYWRELADRIGLQIVTVTKTWLTSHAKKGRR